MWIGQAVNGALSCSCNLCDPNSKIKNRNPQWITCDHTEWKIRLYEHYQSVVCQAPWTNSDTCVWGLRHKHTLSPRHRDTQTQQNRVPCSPVHCYTYLCPWINGQEHNILPKSEPPTLMIRFPIFIFSRLNNVLWLSYFRNQTRDNTVCLPPTIWLIDKAKEIHLNLKLP